MTDAWTQMMTAMMAQGQEMAKAFAPALEGIDVKGFEKLFPTMPKDMLEAWFGKTFNPEGLDARTRLLVTIAALTVLGAHADAQLRLTIRQALSAGATKREVAEVIWQMSMFGDLTLGGPGGQRLPDGQAQLRVGLRPQHGQGGDGHQQAGAGIQALGVEGLAEPGLKHVLGHRREQFLEALDVDPLQRGGEGLGHLLALGHHGGHHLGEGVGHW